MDTSPAPRRPRRPAVHFLKESQLGQDSWHSLLISLLRGAAALQVAAAHLRAELMPGLRTLEHPALWYQALAFLTGFAHQAVIVFFVISGWLVGGSLLNKLGQPEAIKLYAIDRVTRLWTVLIPTFALVLLIGGVIGEIDPRSLDFSPTNEYSALSFVGNLLGLQTVTLPRFGGNYPLWSLANESWYYLMFPLLMLSMSGASTGRRVLAAVVLVAVATILPTFLVLYFSIWLLGALFSRVRIECGAAPRLAVLLLLVGASVYFRLTGNNDEFGSESLGQDFLLGFLLLLLLSSSMAPLGRSRAIAGLNRVGQFFSNFSFTLYVIHVPLLGLLAWVGVQIVGKSQLGAESPQDLAVYLAMLMLLVVFAYGFYRLFEARTYAVRRLMKNLFVGRLPVAARAAPAKH